MRSRFHFISALTGLLMAGLSFGGGLTLLRATAWEVADPKAMIFTDALLILSFGAGVSLFVHLIRDDHPAGVLSGVLLLTIGTYPFACSFYYLFIGPSYGGLIGGIGAAIALAVFIISLLATLSGLILIFFSLKTRK